MKKLTKKWLDRLYWIGFICYLAILIYFLFFSEGYNRQDIGVGYRYNLKPLNEIKRYIYVGFTDKRFLVNVLGNIVAFIPFGLALPLISHHKQKFVSVLLLGIEFIIMVETVQLMSKVGVFDVDDIILNTAGVILGYWIFMIGKGCVLLSRRIKTVKNRR